MKKSYIFLLAATLTAPAFAQTTMEPDPTPKASYYNPRTDPDSFYRHRHDKVDKNGGYQRGAYAQHVLSQDRPIGTLPN
jgi:hypothetical protein